MSRSRLVVITPAEKLFPYDVYRPAFEGVDVEIVPVVCRDKAEVVRAVPGADVVMVGGHRIDADVIAAMDRARAVCGFAHGFESIDLEAATRAGILVTNAARMCHLEVATHAAALILALNRKLFQYDRAMRRGVWDRPAGRPIQPVEEQVIGLVGLGAIGQALARRLAPFGARVTAYDPYVEDWVPRDLGVRMEQTLEGVLAEADHVSVQVPYNRETHHLVGEKQLRAMKPTACLVNCCRGGVVDEAALVRALEAGWIGGAGLDVFEREPLDPASPLLRLDNVITTPHAAGESTQSGALSAKVASQQAAAVLRGEWPARVVNPEVWARFRRAPAPTGR